ncbi:hypothetical protein SLA2020_269510 [Shorea laevis]
MVRRLRVDLVCLIETRVKVEKVDKITEAMLPEWGICSNYEFNPLGRIWVCWNKEALDIAVLSKSEQDISCRIEDLKMGKVWFNLHLRANKGADRRRLWDRLRMVKNQVGQEPWLLGGDFNVVLSVEEKWGMIDLTLMRKILKSVLEILKLRI